MANAIRTIVQASGYINGNKKAKINVDSFKNYCLVPFISVEKV